MINLTTIFDLEAFLLKSRIAGKFHAIKGVKVFHDGVMVETHAGDGPLALKELTLLLGDYARIEDDGDNQKAIRLSPEIRLPIILEEDDETSDTRQKYPLFPLVKDIVLLDNDSKGEEIAESIFTDYSESPSPVVMTFFSFKGGVGRTLHLTALASLLAKQCGSTFSQPKVLVVDADTEAPGLTWWFTNNNENPPEYSYLDLLGEAGWDRKVAVERAANAVKSLRIRMGGDDRYCFFLPAFRNVLQIMRPPVLPEQLTQNFNEPWILGNLVVELGKSLGVEYVLIDLRAGLSELSSPLLLDPRFHRTIVTTTSFQSVQGTKVILRQIRLFANIFPDEKGYPYADKTKVIFSFVPPNARIDEWEDQLSPILDDFPSRDRQAALSDKDNNGKGANAKSILSFPDWFTKTEFSQSLLGLGNFDQALAAIHSYPALTSAVEEISPYRQPDADVVA